MERSEVEKQIERSGFFKKEGSIYEKFSYKEWEEKDTNEMYKIVDVLIDETYKYYNVMKFEMEEDMFRFFSMGDLKDLTELRYSQIEKINVITSVF
jgi:hypothetical protein